MPARLQLVEAGHDQVAHVRHQPAARRLVGVPPRLEVEGHQHRLHRHHRHRLGHERIGPRRHLRRRIDRRQHRVGQRQQMERRRIDPIRAEQLRRRPHHVEEARRPRPPAAPPARPPAPSGSPLRRLHLARGRGSGPPSAASRSPPSPVATRFPARSASRADLAPRQHVHLLVVERERDRIPCAARRSAGSSPAKVVKYSSTSLCTIPSWVAGRSRTAFMFSIDPALSCTLSVSPHSAPSAARSRPIWI